MKARKITGSLFFVLLVIVVFWMWPKDGSRIVSAQYPPYPCPDDPLTNPYLCRDTKTPGPNGYPYPYPVDSTLYSYPFPESATPIPVTNTPTPSATVLPKTSHVRNSTGADNKPANIPTQSIQSRNWIARALERFSVFLRGLGR